VPKDEQRAAIAAPSIDNGTPAARRVRKARGLSQIAQPPKGATMSLLIVVPAVVWALVLLAVVGLCRASSRGDRSLALPPS
jgi:hypothetical protein